MKKKSISLTSPAWQEIKSFADELSAERGVRVTLPQTVLEAIKAYRDARAAGTPGGQAQARE